MTPAAVPAAQASILNALPASAAVIDRGGIILAVNDAWRRSGTANVMHGPRFGVGLNYLDACAHATGNCAEDAHAAAAGIRRVLQDEVRGFAADYPCHFTERRWFRLTVSPLREERLVGALVMHADITKDKGTEEEVRTSHKRLRDLIDGLGPSMFVGLMTPQGLLIEANRSALAPAGLKLSDIVGKRLEDTYWLNYSPVVQQQLRDAIARGARGEASHYDMQVRIGDNHFIDVGFSLQPVRDETGAVTLLVPSAAVITTRKQVENALRESDEKFRLLADHITDAFWIRSPDMRELHFLSPAFERIWGRSPQSLHASPHEWVDFIVPEDRDRVRDVFAGLTADAPFVDCEYRIVRPDGEIRWVRARGFQVRDADGTLVRLTGIATDITERRRAAEVLLAEIAERKRAEDAADAANRSKSEFLANMSHEIRTPLNGVIGMTALTLGTELSAEQREYMEMIKASGESLLSVIDDILDFSKIEAGQLTIEVIPFELHDCLATTLKLLVTRARGRALELACDIHPGVPARVLGDPGRLRQIVTNLVGNAIKFSEQGVVMLTVGVEAQTDRHARLRFSVTDTGVGIPEDKQAAIFEPFIQADSSTTRKYGGTGLGLAISTTLVTLLGGRIWLESESGKGSTFHFTLPFDLPVDAQWGETPYVEAGFSRPAETATAGDRPSLSSGRRLRILLAEDNTVNQMVASRLLEKHGHTVIVAVNGQEALASLDEPDQPFDLVLMDMQMPGMDGFAATAIIRAREQASGAHMPIIAMTALAMTGDRQRCLAAGMDGYVSKPFDVEAVFAEIDRVLS